MGRKKGGPGGTEIIWHVTLYMGATTSNKNTASRSKALVVNKFGYDDIEPIRCYTSKAERL